MTEDQVRRIVLQVLLETLRGCYVSHTDSTRELDSEKWIENIMEMTEQAKPAELKFFKG